MRRMCPLGYCKCTFFCHFHLKYTWKQKLFSFHQIPLFQQYPHLKQCIRPAIERAVQELLAPVVERCIKICLTTVEMIVKKDFSLDPEESRTRTAAHHMARNITAGMAMITCKDPLQQTLNSHIKSNLLATLRVSLLFMNIFMNIWISYHIQVLPMIFVRTFISELCFRSMIWLSCSL